MADHYTDDTDINFKGNPYNIDTGQQLSAVGMRAALHTKENISNKKDILTNSSTEYPSSKAVYTYAAAMFPIGTILMYDGNNWVDDSTIPGWYICKAENAGHGCPNLTNKFLRGSTSSGNPGGSDTAGIKLEVKHLPPHSHGDPTTNGQPGPYEPGTGMWWVGAGTGYDYGAQSAPTTETGGGETYTISTVPSYYSVIYIRKCYNR